MNLRSVHRNSYIPTVVVAIAALPAAVAWAGSGSQALLFVESIADGVNGAEGMRQVRSVTVSPDGAHAYVTSERSGGVLGSVVNPGSLVTFSRDALTGVLTFVQTILGADGSDYGLQALDYARSAVVSPDGAHVYVASYDLFGPQDPAFVAAFARNPVTGKLTFLEAWSGGANGIEALDGARQIVVSPDGAQVYVAAGEVVLFDRNSSTGALTFVDATTLSGTAVAEALGFSPDGAHLYVRGNDALVVLARNATTGLLTEVESLVDDTAGVDGLSGRGAVVVSPDGAHVYTGSVGDRSLAVFDRDASTGELTFVEIHIDGVGGVDGLNNVVSGYRAVGPVAISADGSHVYATGENDHGVATFSRDAITGSLTFVETQFEAVGSVRRMGAPKSVTVSPDDGQVYVGGEGVVTFERDAGTGTLAFVDSVSTSATGPKAIEFSADGLYLYVAGWFENAVSVFARDAGTGELALVESEHHGVDGVTGLYGPKRIAISPDGAHLYVASERGAGPGFSSTSATAIFDRDPLSGELTFNQQFEATEYNELEISPDGANLYAATFDGGDVYSRNATTGELTFLSNPGFMVDDLVLSPDGLFLYSTPIGIQMYNRDPSTGELSRDPLASVAGAHSIAISTDGANIYGVGKHVSSLNEGPITTYSRDPGTGFLSLISSQFDDLFGPVEVSPDDLQVYTTRFDEIAVFQRDTTSGDLTLAQTGTDVLAGPQQFAASPDDAFVYVAREGNDGGKAGGISIFRRVAACPPAPEMGCKQSTRSGGSKLVMKDRTDDAKDRVTWKLGRGEATTLADLGDPLTTSHYALCIYDANSGEPQPRAGALAPAAGECFGTKRRPCWQSREASGVRYNYLDRNQTGGLTPDGIGSLQLREAAAGRTKLLVRAQGQRFDFPALPLVAPVEVRLRNLETGTCWGATYSSLQRNTPEQLTAKSD